MTKAAIFALSLLGLAACAPAFAQSLHSHQGFRAGPDMSAEQILEACIGFAESASGDGSELYQTAHSDYRYCLADLRSAAQPEAAETVGPALTALLPEADPVVAMHTILELGRLGYRPATPQVAEALRSDDWRVVLSAARALGAIGDASHLDALAGVISDAPELASWQAEQAYLVLGGEWPFDENSAAMLEAMSPAERREWLQLVEQDREFARATYAELDETRAAMSFWAGDRNTFGQLMSAGIDFDTGEFLEACPDQVFVDQDLNEVDLTRAPPLDPGIISPGPSFDIALPWGGRLIGERDTNPQWLGAGPAQLRWVGSNEEEVLLYEQPISFIIEDDRGTFLIAGPGEGPSNGSILRLAPEPSGHPRIEKVFELPGQAIMASRFGAGRFALMTMEQAGYAFGPDGAVEPLRCKHWLDAQVSQGAR